MYYQTPIPSPRTFASTHAQTIAQRVQLLQEFLPGIRSIAELCCGDCYRQWRAYTETWDGCRLLGLDIEPHIVAQNKVRGIPCVQGDVLDKAVLTQFQAFDVIFFGPPLSHNCDGHHLLSFQEIVPHYDIVAHFLLGELTFNGTFICICPKATTMGDITWLYRQIRTYRLNIGLRLIHHSYATLTGNGEKTDLRLKYIELWFSSHLGDAWELRASQPI